MDNLTEFKETSEVTSVPESIQEIAAALYQACGAYDMPDKVLDVLGILANGVIPNLPDDFLPITPESEGKVFMPLHPNDCFLSHGFVDYLNLDTELGKERARKSYSDMIECVYQYGVYDCSKHS